MAQILRGNSVQKTGGIAGVVALGQGVGKTGSAGANVGGLIWIASMSICTTATSIVAIPATQLMFSFYGNVYNSGYLVQPLNIVPICFSNVPSQGNTQAISLQISDSYAVFKPLLSVSIVPSVAVFQFLGVVVSGP